MSYIHTDGVEYSDDKKTLVRGPKEATEITILDSRMFGYYSGVKGCVSYVLCKRAIGILASVA